ncbi:MAG: hypothetical protein H6680_03950 [Desulfobacteraceae bacterium]|nr:hypothetical protein [Desulfobacteraceae bacterium]
MKKKLVIIEVVFLKIFLCINSFAVEISDVPLISSMTKPPAHIMFIVDNSGSMNWETMMEGENEGLFKTDLGVLSYGYIFGWGGLLDYPKITGLAKRYIKPRCAAFNRIYYNPKSEYLPWPGTGFYAHHDADMRYPKIIQFNDNEGTFADIFDGAEEIDLFERYLTITNGKFNITSDDSDAGVVFSNNEDWEDKDYFAAYKSTLHVTSKPGAYIEIPLDLPSDGTYSLTAYWPLLFGDQPSGKAEFEIQLYESRQKIKDPIFKDQNGNGGGELGLDAGIGDKNGNLGEFTISSDELNPNGPDIMVVIKHPGNSDGEPYFIKADRIEAVYQYGATTEFAGLDDFVVRINNAHYFTWDDINENNNFDDGETIYLVNFILENGESNSGEEFEYKNPDDDETFTAKVRREYFRVEEQEGILKKDFYLDEEGIIGSGELVPVSDLPHHAKRFKSSSDDGSPVYMTAKEDLLNFANWFEFYRTRLLSAKSAMARTISDISNVVVGLYTINHSVREPGLGVKTYMPSTCIVDDDDMDEGAYSEEGGGINKWDDSYAAVSYNKSSRRTNRKINYSDYRAKWKIKDIEESGTYKVYVRWTRYTGPFGNIVDRDPNAKYYVYKVSGDNKTLVKSMEVNQNGGTKNDWDEEMLPDFWNRICDVTIGEGDKIHVELQRGTNSWLEYTSADAVKAVNEDSTDDVDNTNELLDLIYKIEAKDDTPLRSALKAVGQYFNTGETPPSESELGDISPFKQNGGECLQAFAILMTDGYWNDRDFSIGNYDNDGVSDTLADVAAKYYQDLDPEVEGLVSSSLCDSNTEQHLVTYSVAFGASGNINHSSFDQCNLADKTSGGPDWPDGPTSSWTKEKIDDLFHASVNSHGAFHNASDPQKLFDALTAIMKDIEIRYNTGSAVSVNSYKVKSDLRVYQSFYNTQGWTGWLKSMKLGKDNSSAVVIVDENGDNEADTAWNTNNFLTPGNFLPAARKILLKDPQGQAVDFFYDELPMTVKSILDPFVTSTETDISENAEQNIEKTVNYLRGENLEGFRDRQSVLGDIVHSSPVKWGNTLYVGANDGMLHAFEEATGKERFAFIPSYVVENLPLLVKQDYSHKYFVDHTPVIERISKGSGDERITEDILVCGLKKGGKGYFALNLKTQDINADEITMTSSENILNLFKWEFPSKSDSDLEHLGDMGFSYSSPVIVKSNIKDHPFIVIFGNGYNSANGDSGIFILDAFTGELITKIMTGTPGDNGMSTPAVVDTDNNQTADFIYSGDLKGNLWKFDISSKVVSKSEANSNWGCFYKSSLNDPEPLFTAKYCDNIQPVTTKPDIAKHSSYHGYIIVFGTGQFLSKNDMNDLGRQSVYGIWDYGDQKDEFLGSISRPDGLNPESKTVISNISNVYLMDQSVQYKKSSSGVTSSSSFSEIEVLSDKKIVWKLKETTDTGESYADLDQGSYAGWYFDLPDSGERVVQDPKIIAGKAVFNSYVPQQAGQMCVSGGYSWFHEIDATDGSRLDSPAFDISGDREIKFNEIQEDDTEVLNDVFRVTTGDTTEYLAPSRVKIQGMAFPPVVVTSEKKEGKLLGTSDGSFKIIDEKRQRLGVFYWRKR